MVGIMRFGYGTHKFKTNVRLDSHDQQIEFKSNITNFVKDDFSSFYYKLNVTDDFSSKNSNFKTFTFIRDPLKHFESGQFSSITSQLEYS